MNNQCSKLDIVRTYLNQNMSFADPLRSFPLQSKMTSGLYTQRSLSRSRALFPRRWICNPSSSTKCIFFRWLSLSTLSIRSEINFGQYFLNFPRWDWKGIPVWRSIWPSNLEKFSTDVLGTKTCLLTTGSSLLNCTWIYIYIYIYKSCWFQSFYQGF